jgi:hypothetical protein
VKVHSAFVGIACQLSNFVWFIDGAYFGGLSNRNNSGLHVVLVTDPVVRRTNCVHGQFTILSGKRDQFASCETFRRAAFVHVNVSCFGTNDRFVGAGKRLKAKAISGGAVEYEKALDILAEVAPEMANGGLGVRVVAIAHDVPAVHGCDRPEDSGMDAGVVITGKAADGLHEGTI